MNGHTSTGRNRNRQLAALCLAGALVLAAGITGSAHDNPSGRSHRLEGTWLVQVTLRNCATNASLGSFNSIVTFHQGGTISESTSSPGFAIGQRGNASGNWAFKGHRTYSQRMVSLINFDTAANLPGTPGFNPTLPVTPGFFAGSSIVTHTLELVDDDHATSSGTNAFYKADGTQYRTGCSTAEATRFE